MKLSRRERRLVAVLMPVLILSLIVNISSLMRLSDKDRHNHYASKVYTGEILQELTRRNMLNLRNDKFTTQTSSNSTNFPFRFYIYDLPPSLNYDIADYFHTSLGTCFNFSNYGMGSEISRTSQGDGSVSVYDTNQFSLEIILHEKLKRNALRTRNPELADIFYIPAYIGLLCEGNRSKAPQAIKLLQDFLTKSFYFSSGKPHFSAISKIHREMASSECPFLTQPFTNQITFVSIEKERLTNSPELGWPYSVWYKNSILVAPYPSYGHFEQYMKADLSTVPLDDRDVFVLLPVGERRSNPQRSKLMDQFEVKTKLPYSRFKMCHENGANKMVLFYTNNCDQDIPKLVTTWMQHSVFCLQPPGDSPSRKSFYDSIMTGCIPVILTYNDGYNPYAFLELIDYTTFTISFKMDLIHDIYSILQDVPKSKIEKMHDKIRQIARYMQYAIPSGKIERENDALQLIFQQLTTKFKLKYDKEMTSM